MGLPAHVALVPDAGVAVPFIYAPQAEGYLKAEVELSSSTPGVEAVYVTVEGTSHNWPRVVLEPEETALEFGEIPKGQRRKVTVKLANIGGRTLNITSLSATDPSNQVTVTFPGGMTTATLDPLQRLNIDVDVNGTTPGIIDLPLHIVSNDPVRAQLDIPIRATITEPKLLANPLTLSWGTMPQGWVVARPVELKNIGYGALTVKRLTFIGGTSNLFSLRRTCPPLPMQLDRNGRVAFEVEFRAQTAAPLRRLGVRRDRRPAEPVLRDPAHRHRRQLHRGLPHRQRHPVLRHGHLLGGQLQHRLARHRPVGERRLRVPGDRHRPGRLLQHRGGQGHAGGQRLVVQPHGDHRLGRRRGLQLHFFGADNSQLFSDNYNVQDHPHQRATRTSSCASAASTPPTASTSATRTATRCAGSRA